MHDIRTVRWSSSNSTRWYSSCAGKHLGAVREELRGLTRRGTHLISPPQLVIAAVLDPLIHCKELSHPMLPNCARRLRRRAEPLNPHPNSAHSPYFRFTRALLQGSGVPDFKKPMMLCHAPSVLQPLWVRGAFWRCQRLGLPRRGGVAQPDARAGPQYRKWRCFDFSEASGHINTGCIVTTARRTDGVGQVGEWERLFLIEWALFWALQQSSHILHWSHEELWLDGSCLSPSSIVLAAVSPSPAALRVARCWSCKAS